MEHIFRRPGNAIGLDSPPFEPQLNIGRTVQIEGPRSYRPRNGQRAVICTTSSFMSCGATSDNIVTKSIVVVMERRTLGFCKRAMAKRMGVRAGLLRRKETLWERRCHCCNSDQNFRLNTCGQPPLSCPIAKIPVGLRERRLNEARGMRPRRTEWFKRGLVRLASQGL